MPTLGKRVNSESSTSLMLQAISHNMAVKKNSKKPVEPSDLLWALKCKPYNLRGGPFDFNIQQDVAKILQVVVNEL